MPEPMELALRVERGIGLDNGLDVKIECALFTPEVGYIAIRPNFAGTKVIYTRDDLTEVTFRAREWTEDRAGAARLLRAKAREGVV